MGSFANLSTDGTLLRAGGSLGSMASLFRDGQKPPQKVLEIIVGYLHRVAHPTYMGILSLEVGWSLARTEEMLRHLEDLGEVHELTPEEKQAQGFRSDANLWTVVGKPRLCKARW